MKKDKVLELLYLIDDDNEILDEVLGLDERIAETLIDSEELFIPILRMAKKEPNVEVCLQKIEIMKFLKNEYLLENGIDYTGLSLEALQLLSKSTSPINAMYAALVLTDKKSVEAGVYLEGAKIIVESKNDFNAYYAYEVLRNADAIEAGIALDGAKIINKSIQESNATYISNILTHPDIYVKWWKPEELLRIAQRINMITREDLLNTIEFFETSMELIDYIDELIARENYSKDKTIEETLIEYVKSFEEEDIAIATLKRIKDKQQKNFPN